MLFSDLFLTRIHWPIASFISTQWSVTGDDSTSSPYYCVFSGKNIGHTNSIPFIFSCLYLCVWIYFKLSHFRNDMRYRFRTKLSIVSFTLHKSSILFKFILLIIYIFYCYCVNIDVINYKNYTLIIWIFFLLKH